MAVFNKNSITQVSGFDNPCITGELVYQQKTFWNLTLTAEDGVSPVSLTGATIDTHTHSHTIDHSQPQ
jgi:microcystin-dependent protein